MPGLDELSRILSSIYSRQNRKAKTSTRNLNTAKTVVDQVSFEMTYEILSVLTTPLWAGESSGHSDASNTYYGDGEYFL